MRCRNTEGRSVGFSGASTLRGGARGFTLVEILLVVALIAIATTLFAMSVQTMGRTTPADELESAFWRAMAQAREKAMTSRRPVEVRFDPEEKHFAIVSVQGTEAVPVGDMSPVKNTDWGVEFSQERPSNELVLVRGALVTRRPVTAVRVYPDGTCQSFAAEFTVEKAKHLVVIDPWTGAELLGSDERQTGER